ncbi:MAG: hypothetical protein ACLS6O_03500 [Bifidobacterium sp.]
MSGAYRRDYVAGPVRMPAQVPVKHAQSRGESPCLRHRGMEAGAGACRHLSVKAAAEMRARWASSA